MTQVPIRRRRSARTQVVEEKFGEQILRVLSEMRGKILYYDPKKLKIKILDQNLMKMQKSTLPKFEISILEQF